MSNEKRISQMENFLLPYIKDRYDVQKAPMGKLLNAFGAAQRIIDLITRVGQAFIRCVCQTEEPLTIEEMANVSTAEAFYMLNTSPYSMRFFRETGARSDLFFQITVEIHRWLLVLQENSLLPGRYQRFTGKFYPEL